MPTVPYLPKAVLCVPAGSRSASDQREGERWRPPAESPPSPPQVAGGKQHPQYDVPGPPPPPSTSPARIQPCEKILRSRRFCRCRRRRDAVPGTCIPDRVGNKKPIQKNPPKKTQKNHKNGFFGFFKIKIFFMKIIQTFLFETDFL
jgi:hypothetical protein